MVFTVSSSQKTLDKCGPSHATVVDGIAVIDAIHAIQAIQATNEIQHPLQQHPQQHPQHDASSNNTKHLIVLIACMNYGYLYAILDSQSHIDIMTTDIFWVSIPQLMQNINIGIWSITPELVIQEYVCVRNALEHSQKTFHSTLFSRDVHDEVPFGAVCRMCDGFDWVYLGQAPTSHPTLTNVCIMRSDYRITRKSSNEIKMRGFVQPNYYSVLAANSTLMMLMNGLTEAFIYFDHMYRSNSIQDISMHMKQLKQLKQSKSKQSKQSKQSMRNDDTLSVIGAAVRVTAYRRQQQHLPAVPAAPAAPVVASVAAQTPAKHHPNNFNHPPRLESIPEAKPTSSSTDSSSTPSPLYGTSPDQHAPLLLRSVHQHVMPLLHTLVAQSTPQPSNVAKPHPPTTSSVKSHVSYQMQLRPLDPIQQQSPTQSQCGDMSGMNGMNGMSPLAHMFPVSLY